MVFANYFLMKHEFSNKILVGAIFGSILCGN